MKVRHFLTVLCLGSFLATSCNQESKQADEKVISESNGTAETGDQAKQPEQTTKIEFEQKEHDFGNIVQGEMVTHIFTFRNAGDSPLVIMDAKASCGCTVPQWTKEPVAPGQTGQIEVKYNGSGSGQINKTVTVIANTEPKETVLEIKANVKPIDKDNKGPFKK